jgi:hypothetical protein
MKLGVKELIKLCIYCWGHPLLYTCSGSVAVWMLLSGNLQQGATASTAKSQLSRRMQTSFAPINGDDYPHLFRFGLSKDTCRLTLHTGLISQ